MIELSKVKNLLDLYAMYVAAESRTFEASIRAKTPASRKMYRDVAIDYRETARLTRERLESYIGSFGAECPTLEELRKAKEVQA